MNKLLRSVTLVFFAALCSCTQSLDQKIEKLEKDKANFDKKVAAMKNDSLKTQAEEMGAMLFAFEKMDLENQRVPTVTEYAVNPLIILDDYSSTTDLVNNYANGILVDRQQDSKSQKDLKIIYPFEFPFQQIAEWNSVKLANNTVLTLKSDKDYQEGAENIVALKSHDLAFNEINVYYAAETTDPKLQPDRLLGKIQATAPKNVLQFKFSIDDEGEIQEKNGIKVKLLSIKDHQVKIEVTNPLKTAAGVNTQDLEWVKVHAKDDTRQYLDYSGHSSGAEGIIDYYKSILTKLIDEPQNITELKKELDKKDKEFESEYKDKYYLTTYFKGKVKEVTVYIFDYSKVVTVKKELNVPVQKFEGSFDRQPIAGIPVDARVYDHEIENLLRGKAEVNPDALDSAIKIQQLPYKKPTENNSAIKARLDFQYPDVLSKLFIKDYNRFTSIKTVTFYDKKDGTAIDIPADSMNLDNHGSSDGWVEFQSSRIEYNPTKFTKEPHYVTGIVQVELADIKKSIYGINQLPAGMQLKGNMLIVDGNILRENDNQYYVKDKSGKYLKMITSRSYESAAGQADGYSIAKYYYGSPFTIERYELVDTGKADYTFGVELNSK